MVEQTGSGMLRWLCAREERHSLAGAQAVWAHAEVEIVVRINEDGCRAGDQGGFVQPGREQDSASQGEGNMIAHSHTLPFLPFLPFLPLAPQALRALRADDRQVALLA